jgi:2-(1,2-epoxy-1,2-dihydrophenyl)acetyl-CoA isomerase
MTEECPLLTRIRDGVMMLTMNRPGALNALDQGLVTALYEAFIEAQESSSVMAVLLTGTGRAFNAGADLSLLQRLTEAERSAGDEVADIMDIEFNPMMRAMQALTKPLIAAVNGPAAGGGASIALTADIVVAAESAYFQLTFGPNLGIVPDLGGSWLFPNTGGRSTGLGMALSGKRLSARDAADQGLIWQCVPDGELADTSQALAARMAAGPSLAYGRIKQLLTAQATSSLADQLQLEADLQREAGQTEDFIEGVSAFMEGRRPVFLGY